MSVFILLLAWMSQVASASPSVAVSYFDNTAGNAAMSPLQKGLAEMLITDLSTSGAITIVERSRLNDVMGEIELQKNPYFDSKSAAELGRGLGADFLVTGSYLVMDESIRIDARVIDVDSSEVVLSVKTSGQTTEWSSLQLELASKLLNGLGSQLSIIEKKNITNNSTQSFTAFTAYSTAVNHIDEGRETEAKAALEDALAADPEFRMARASLDEVSKRVQQARTEMAEDSSNWPSKVQSLIARHAAGDTNACYNFMVLVKEEAQLIMAGQRTQLPFQSGFSGGAPPIQLPQVAGAPKNSQEAGQRVNRLLKLAEATRSQDLKAVSVRGNGATVTCHPEAVLISTALGLTLTSVSTSMERLSGKEPLEIMNLRPLDEEQNPLSDVALLELFLAQANRLLELTPKEATMVYGHYIERAVKTLKIQRLPEADRIKAEQHEKTEQFIQSVQRELVVFSLHSMHEVDGTLLTYAYKREEPLVAAATRRRVERRNLSDLGDYSDLIESIQYSCDGQWCTWPRLGRGKPTVEMPNIPIDSNALNLLDIEYMWPMGFDVEGPLTLAIHLVDGRVIEVNLPPPLSPTQKRKFLHQEFGTQMRAMNLFQARDRDIDETLQNMLEAANEAKDANQMEGMARQMALLKSNTLANSLGCEPSVFEKYRKLMTSEVKLHANKTQVKSPKTVSPAGSASVPVPWTLWNKGQLEESTRLESFRWITTHHGREDVPVPINDLTNWTADELSQGLNFIRKRSKNDPLLMQGHVLRLESGESIELQVETKGYTPDIVVLQNSFWRGVATTNIASGQCTGGFSTMWKASDGSYQQECFSEQQNAKHKTFLAEMVETKGGPGTTTFRLNSPVEEYGSFYFVFVGTKGTNADYRLNIRARPMEFVKVKPSGPGVSPKPFMMSKTEVTNWQYFETMGTFENGVCEGYGMSSNKWLNKKCGINYPIKSINWYEAAKFANALSIKEGLQPAYDIQSSMRLKKGANGYRLPTRKQWEAAALAHEPVVALKDRCAIANSLELSGITTGLTDGLARNDTSAAKTAMSCDDGFGGLAPVASFAPNKFGLYDMLGNVWEWVWDEDDEKTKSKGGGYALLLQHLSPTITEEIPPESRGDPLGFRLVRPIE